MGVCRRYLKNKEEAEDCLQDAFIKIFKNLDSFRNEGDLAAWARRVTVNTILTRLNSKKIMTEELDSTFEYSTSLCYNNTELTVNVEDLLKIINALSGDKRTVFNLYVIEGFSHKEIAEVLNIKEAYSRNLFSKARKELMNELNNRR